jgi:ABC-2 type transport system ATP-binding protein
VLGPNGAGKTSTIEVCEGYRTASAGSARVLGLDPATQQRLLSERMGVMLQEGGVYPSARVLDTVRHYCALYGKGADAVALVDQVGLTDGASHLAALSGGEKQRLSLALAMAARPEVAFLDEPTSGVDVNGRDTIRGIVRDLAAGGCAVVLATHELDEAERLADRVVIFDRAGHRRRHAGRAAQGPRRDPLPQQPGPRHRGAGHEHRHGGQPPSATTSTSSTRHRTRA